MERNRELYKKFTNSAGLTHTETVTIETLVDYEVSGLVKISDVVELYGNFAIVCGNEYATFNAPVSVITHPDKTEIFNRDGVPYYRFTIDPGSYIIESLSRPKDPVKIIKYFERVRVRGRIPWYFTYDDVLNFLNGAKVYGGSRVGNYRTTIELLGALTAREGGNYEKMYRHNLEGKELEYIGLSNPILSTSGTMNKLLNSYSHDGIISAIVMEDDVIDRPERILRA